MDDINIWFLALNTVILIFNGFISWSNYRRNRRIWEVEEIAVPEGDNQNKERLRNQLKTGKFTVLKIYQDHQTIRKQLIYLLGRIAK